MDMRKDRELAILNIVKAARLVDEYVHKKPDPSNPEQLIDFMNVSDKYSRYLDGVRSTLSRVFDPGMIDANLPQYQLIDLSFYA